MRPRCGLGNHISTRERRKYRGRSEDEPFGAGSGADSVSSRQAVTAAWRHAAASAGRDWADVTRVPSGDERLQAVLSVTGTDSAAPAHRFRQVRRRGVETRETGNRFRRRHPVRTTGTPRSARPVTAGSKDGKIDRLYRALVPATERGAMRSGDVSPRASPLRTGPEFGRSRVHEPSRLLGRRACLRGTQSVGLNTCAPGASIIL